MKNSLIILVGSLMITAALTACGGGGGGSSDPGPSSAAAAGILGNGQGGYLGKGDWSGNVTGQNVGSQQYQMFMWQYGGGQFSTLVNLRIWSGRRGILPEQMGFSINGRNLGGDAFINGNGILINNYQQFGFGGGGYGYQPYQTQCFSYPCQGANGTPVIQITTQFVDQCRSIMNVQVRYQSVTVLSGQITAAQPVQFNIPYNTYGPVNQYGQPYPGYIPGQPYGQNIYANIPAQCYMQQQAYQQQYQQQYSDPNTIY